MRLNQIRCIFLGALLVLLLACSIQPAAATDGYQFVTKWGTTGSNDQFSSTGEVAVDGAGNVYVIDSGRNEILKFTSTGAFITKWGSYGVGDGQFRGPAGIAANAAGYVYVTDWLRHTVIKFTSTGGFVTEWGSEGTGDGQFSGPGGIAVDGAGNVYVADTDNHRIQKFSASGTFLGKWGSEGSGDGQFQSLSGLAADAAGAVYIIDYLDNRVQKFDSNGTFISKWGSPGTGNGEFYDPIGIATSAAGDVYVIDGSEWTDVHRVQKFTSTGTFLATWGTRGSGDGQFKLPRGIAVDGAGSVFVTDYYKRVQKFTSTGAFVTKWGTTGSADGQLNYPSGIETNSSGYVYVVDPWNNQVQVFTSTGGFVRKWGSLGSGVGQFDFPSGIAIDSHDFVYIADSRNYRVQKFTPAGTFVATWESRDPGSSEGPKDVAVDAEGYIYIIQHQVKKFTSTGTFVKQWGYYGSGDGSLMRAEEIAASPGGDIYVTDIDTKRVQIFDPNGAFLGKWSTSGIPNSIAIDTAGDVFIGASDQVSKFTPTGTLITQFGSRGTGDGQFNGIGGVAVDGSGSVYVVDGGATPVQKFAWGESPFVEIAGIYPVGVAVDSAGNLFVATQDERVAKYNASLNLVTSWAAGVRTGSESNPDEGLGGLGADSNGNVYVADGGDNSIKKYTGAGALVTTFGSQGSAAGQVDWPRDVGVAATDSIYIADYRNSRVDRFTKNGQFVSSFGVNGSGHGQLYYPSGCAVDSAGNVYVADTGNDRIQKFTANGAFLATWDAVGSQDGQFWHPEGVAADRAGNVYVADTGNYRVQMFTSSGEHVKTVGVYINRPSDIDVDQAGNLYVAGYDRVLIVKNQSFKPVTTPTPTPRIPIANFSAVPTNGTAPLSVQFTDRSGNNPTSWTWDFGDGSMSTVRHPSHVYVAPGNFTVNLTVSNSFGSASMTTTVQVRPAPSVPVANFTWSPTNVTTGKPVQFMDTSSNSPSEWFWIIDNVAYFEQNPTHTFATAGPKTVMLIASNQFGSSNAKIEVIAVVNGSVTPTPTVTQVPGGSAAPHDSNGDGKYDDVNGNNRPDFADVVLYFNQMSWIAANEPVALFDFNGNGRIDFSDVVWLFNHL